MTDTKESMENESIQNIDSNRHEKDSIKRFQCELCGKTFARRGSYNKHGKNLHNKTVKANHPLIKCVNCATPVSFFTLKMLRNHLKTDHGLEMDEQYISFFTMEEFLTWKIRYEKITRSSYVMQRGVQMDGNDKVYRYVCNRTGLFLSRKGKGKRALKSQGSCKIGMACTAFIKAVAKKKRVQVSYCSQHYGHKEEIQHLRFKDVLHSSFASFEELEAPFQEVLNDQVESLLQKNQFRCKMVQLKDMHRIKKALSTKTQDFEMTDAESLDQWVRSCFQMENSPVLLYKPETFDAESRDGFVLVIMTEYQKHTLLSCAKKVVCVDRILWRKGFRYYVNVLYVIDEYNLAFPCAFCVSSKVNKTTMLLFFDVIKQTTGCLDTDYFMSDNEEFFCEAWREIMNSNALWLWNTWDVDTRWKGKLWRLYKGSIEKRAELYNRMRSIMECQNESVLTSTLHTFTSSLIGDAESEELGRYIKQRYSPFVDLWAFCYRKDLGVGTTLNLEALHQTLRSCAHHEGRKKRLDQYIFILMKLVRDKIFDRLSIIDSEKVILALENINWCHKAALNFPAGNIKALSEDAWEVTSVATKELFNVSLDNASCSDHCSLVCEECDICMHMFTCSCYANLINAYLCEHIHAVALYCSSPKINAAKSRLKHNSSKFAVSVDTRASETPNEFFYKTLTRSYQLCEKLKSSKFHLDHNDLKKIVKSVNECMEICEQKLLLSDSDEDNPEFKDFSVDTAVSLYSVNKSSANVHKSSNRIPVNTESLAQIVIPSDGTKQKSFIRKKDGVNRLTKLNECMEISEQKCLLSESDDDNPEFKDFSIDTAVSLYSVNKSSANVHKSSNRIPVSAESLAQIVIPSDGAKQKSFIRKKDGLNRSTKLNECMEISEQKCLLSESDDVNPEFKDFSIDTAVSLYSVNKSSANVHKSSNRIPVSAESLAQIVIPSDGAKQKSFILKKDGLNRSTKLNECMEISEKKCLLSESDDDNPEFKDFSIDTAVSLYSVNKSSANVHKYLNRIPVSAEGLVQIVFPSDGAKQKPFIRKNDGVNRSSKLNECMEISVQKRLLSESDDENPEFKDFSVDTAVSLYSVNRSSENVHKSSNRIPVSAEGLVQIVIPSDGAKQKSFIRKNNVVNGSSKLTLDNVILKHTRQEIPGMKKEGLNSLSTLSGCETFPMISTVETLSSQDFNMLSNDKLSSRTVLATTVPVRSLRFVKAIDETCKISTLKTDTSPHYVSVTARNTTKRNALQNNLTFLARKDSNRTLCKNMFFKDSALVKATARKSITTKRKS